jgi:hypothetical protein
MVGITPSEASTVAHSYLLFPCRLLSPEISSPKVLVAGYYVVVSKKWLDELGGGARSLDQCTSLRYLSIGTSSMSTHNMFNDA